VVFNVCPFKEPKSKVVHQSFAGRDDEILASHEYIASQLRSADAVIVAWGDGPQASIEWARRLLAGINAGREKPIATWCLGTNDSGQPTHPSPLAKVPLTTQAKEWNPRFNQSKNYKSSRSVKSEAGITARNGQRERRMSSPSESVSESVILSSVGNSPALQEAARSFYLILKENPSLHWDRVETRITISNAERRLLRLGREGNVDLIVHDEVVNLSKKLRILMNPRKDKFLKFLSSDVTKTKEVMLHVNEAFRRLSRGEF
jgi:hypothetical protein